MENEIKTAVHAIKNSILQSQYEAAKDVNRVQLSLYFGVGKYLFAKKGKKSWGTSVLETISTHLRKELPGLRGFSATNLKNMRLFYENWQFLDSNSSVMTDEFQGLPQGQNSVVTTTEIMPEKIQRVMPDIEELRKLLTDSNNGEKK